MENPIINFLAVRDKKKQPLKMAVSTNWSVLKPIKKKEITR
jgi:hypothetical protein